MKGKFYKLLSIVVAVVLIVTCCSVALTTTVVATETQHIYYLAADDYTYPGSDENTGLTPEDPLLTVSAAITKAVADAEANDYNTPENKVYFKILGTTAVAWGTRTTANITDTNKNVVSQTQNAALPNFDFTLNISSDTSGATVGNGMAGFLGPVEFENIKIYVNDSSLTLGGNDVKFLEGVTFTGTSNQKIALGVHAGSHTLNESQEVYIGSSTTTFYIGNYQSSATYNADVNITYDYDGSKTFYFGTMNYGTSTFNKNVNINVRNATSFDLSKKYAKFGDNAAVQILNQTSVDVASKSGVVSIVNDGVTSYSSSGNSVTTTAPVYILSHDAASVSHKDIVSFTETAGVYTIKKGYQVIATKDNNQSVVVTVGLKDSEAVLDLREYVAESTGEGGEVIPAIGTQGAGAGAYTLSISKFPETKYYYIASATDGGKSENTGLSSSYPLLTVNEAITKATEDGAQSVDTVVIKVVGTNAAADWGTDIAYSFKKLIIESNDPNNHSSLNLTTSNNLTPLMGELEIDNITLKAVTASGNPSRFYIHGRSVTLGPNTTVSPDYSTLILSFSEKTVSGAQTITIKNSYKGLVNVGHYNTSGITFNGDLSFIIDNASSTPDFKFSSTYGSAGANKVNGNMNFAIYDAKSVSFGAKKENYTISGAVQVISPSDITVDTTNLTTLSSTNTAAAGGLYHIVDDTGIAHGVEFVPEYDAGTYKLNIDRKRYDVYCTPDGGTAAPVEGDTLTVTEPGKYTVSVVKKKETVNYFISATTGNDDWNGETEATAVKTLNKAISLANSASYIAGDTVILNFIDGDQVSHTGTIPTYTYKLVLKGVNQQGNLYITENTNLGGNTDFVNMYVKSASGKALRFFNYNVTFDEDSVCAVSYTYTGKNNSGVYVPGQQVEFNGTVSSWCITLANSNGGNTYTAPFNVTIANYIGTTEELSLNAVDYKTTFNSALNINIKNAAKDIKISGDVSNDRFTFGENGALQLINSTGRAVTETEALKAISTDKKYILTVANKYKDVLTFTDEIGKYDINGIDLDAYDVVAINKADEIGTEIPAVDGCLNLSAGEYTIEIREKVPGDINLDKKVTICDLVCIGDIVNKATITYEYDSYAADRNGDGKVTEADIELLRNYLLTVVSQ